MKTLQAFCEQHHLSFTPLRKEIFSILFYSKKPLGAYDVLEKLKKSRENAEPPTVYRVLKWLVDEQLVHRIESQNAYVFCSHAREHVDEHKTLLLSCRACGGSFEYEDKTVVRAIEKFVKMNRIQVDDHLIEIKGLCETCA